MLHIVIDSDDLFNNETNEFYTIKGQTLVLEHSLVSVSKWEAKYQKPFLSTISKITYEELQYYVKCMTITQNVNPMLYTLINDEQYKQIIKYMDNKMSATFFGEDETNEDVPRPYHKKQIITSELIYYWMVAFQIPFECQKWHLNRLLTLIRICNTKNKDASPDKKPKIGRSQTAMRMAAMNKRRKRKTGSRG